MRLCFSFFRKRSLFFYCLMWQKRMVEIKMASLLSSENAWAYSLKLEAYDKKLQIVIPTR